MDSTTSIPSPLTSIHIQSQSPNSNPDHTLTVLEELDGFGVEGKVSEVLVIEEMNSVFVEMKGQCLEEGDIVGQNFFIWEVQLEHDDGIDVVVR